MMISVWRYSHLVLAVSSFVFVVLLSVTGIILSFEPITEHPSAQHNLDDYQLNDVIEVLREQYDEVFSLKVTAYDEVIVSAMDGEGEMGDFYFDLDKGASLGVENKPSRFFDLVTSLHRSLFMKSFGRFFVGLNAFLLLLITLSGVVLIAKRQQGLVKFFTNVTKDNNYQYFHVVLSRWLLVPILVICLSGTYLWLVRFDVVPDGKEATIVGETEGNFLEQLSLAEVAQLDFPFSPDEEDFFILKTSDRQLELQQYTGAIMSGSYFPIQKTLADLSLLLHTGRGSQLWSIVLALACLGILFFVYSGFWMTLHRRKSKLKNVFRKEDCDHVILIGSEGGTTSTFAVWFQQQMLALGEKVYIAPLNSYEVFPKMTQLTVFTATYGVGEAPANASQFLKRADQHDQPNEFHFNVVAFGSLAYADFCQFGHDVASKLQQKINAIDLLPVHTIHNRSWESFRQWAMEWSQKNEMEWLPPAQSPFAEKKKKTELFEVMHKTAASENPDETFVVALKPKVKTKFKSGDLLGVLPAADPYERLYSIARVDERQILLSVKRHAMGVCSNYLNDLKVGQSLQGAIQRNPEFHFPAKARTVTMIGTGTGIAPFLGMLSENKHQIPVFMYWGGRTKASFALYEKWVNEAKATQKLTDVRLALSRESAQKVYVQHLVEEDGLALAKRLAKGGVIMICGSIAMQQQVTMILNEMTQKYNRQPLSYYQQRAQVRMDCY